MTQTISAEPAREPTVLVMYEPKKREITRFVNRTATHYFSIAETRAVDHELLAQIRSEPETV